MNEFQAIILGIVQGLTEFLPVSSSGHLAVFKELLGVSSDNIVFDVAVHLGTLVPVVVIYRDDILALLKKPFQKMTGLLIIATIPAGLAAIFLDDLIDSLFKGGMILSLCFAITGVLLLFSDTFAKKAKKRDRDITYIDAIIIGLVQSVAITPGISRSGSTITAGLFRGLSRETAAKFSFLMSIPAILGAVVLQVKDIATGDVVIASGDILPMILGFVTAMLSGYLAIRFFIGLLNRGKLKYFAFYVFALAVVWLVFNIL